MFKRQITYGIIVALVIVVAGCSSDNTDEPVASVGEKVLYRSNVKEILPKGISAEDSISMSNNYIDKWIKQELLIQKADENLNAEQKDLHKELEEYRNSLIIYKYKNELIKQRMDTVVTNRQIEEFYNNNPSNFNLNHSIVKATFIMIPDDLADPTLVKELIDDTSPEGIDELREYCGQYAKKVNISADEWISFQMLKKNFPNEMEEEEAFLKQNKLYEMNDSNYYYIVSIHDYKLSNDLAPIEFVRNNIKNLILNKRKIEFLKEIEENIYTEGVRKKKFRKYDTKTN
ncbi:hypothetical protein [Draconibacterium halophilum]|uniref:Peptidyl-prolyl cis-trans isomerase n=1 Tax=Draconibacterium halophilum TaxID=2706887 RepID=A0A6C0REE0_9BACT|nr:hypothetical protein [Draconibacterium halophilum]QIA08750.1 hypothetical protein G0Q07_13925 [Draconibacterium halophilum]